jgi:hypothetical protein
VIGDNALYTGEYLIGRPNAGNIVRLDFDGLATTVIPDQNAIQGIAVIGSSLLWTADVYSCVDCGPEIRQALLTGGPRPRSFPQWQTKAH